MKTRIKVLRAINEMKQSDLAKKMGVSQSMVSFWENGEKKMPEDRVAQLERIFGEKRENIFVSSKN